MTFQLHFPTVHMAGFINNFHHVIYERPLVTGTIAGTGQHSTGRGLHLHQGLHSSSARRPAHTASRGATTLNIFNSATNIFHRYKIYKYFSNNHFRPKMHFHHHACSWHSIQKDCILPSLWNSIYNLNLDFVILTISTRVWQFSRQCQWCYNKFLAQWPWMRI